MKTFYVDGKFVPEDQAVVPVDDLAVLRGYAVCDIMRTYKGIPYFIDEHITRLEKSAEKIGLVLPWDHSCLLNIVLEVIEKNKNIDEANIRIIITGGSSPDYFTPAQKPRLIVMVTALPTLPPSWYTKGVKVITHIQERNMPDAKVTAYIPAAIALKKAKAAGAVEAIYVNAKGLALEATTSNLFAVINSRLVTPDSGMLKGITRQVILSMAKKIITSEERPLMADELLKADEVFITATNKGVIPVVQIDDTLIGKGVPGKITLEIMKSLDRHAQKFKTGD